MSESQDMLHALARAFEMLRAHQDTLFKTTLSAMALVNALKETNPALATAYDRQFWELKQGALGEQNNVAVRMIDEITRQLRSAHAQGS